MIYRRLRASAVRTVKSVLYSSGAYMRLRDHRTPSSMVVAMFHRVLPADHPHWCCEIPGYTITDDVFEKSVEFLCRHYEPVSEQQVLHSLSDGAALPKHAVLITFDDGWIDTLTVAGPILAKHRLPSIVFIPPAIFDSPGPFWQELLTYNVAIGRLGLRDLDAIVAATMPEGGWTPSASAQEALSRVLIVLTETAPAQREAAIEAIAPSLLHDGSRHFLSAGQLQDLAALKMDVGAHGYSHNALTTVDDPMADLNASRVVLRDLLGREVLTMSVPHGRLNAAIAAHAFSAGFAAVFTSMSVTNRLSDGLLGSKLLGRHYIGPKARPGDYLHEWIYGDYGAIDQHTLRIN